MPQITVRLVAVVARVRGNVGNLGNIGNLGDPVAGFAAVAATWAFTCPGTIPQTLNILEQGRRWQMQSQITQTTVEGNAGGVLHVTDATLELVGIDVEAAD